MVTLILLAVLASDGGTSIPPLLKAPEPLEPITVVPVPYHEGIDKKWMVKPPCGPMAEIGGYCFVRTEDAPPCPKTTKAHGERCYKPLVRLPDKTGEPRK